MKMIFRMAAIAAIAASSAGCAAISDAPEAGSETFTPISNNAYLVRQGPMLDRYWIDGELPEASVRPPGRRAPAQRLYK